MSESEDSDLWPQGLLFVVWYIVSFCTLSFGFSCVFLSPAAAIMDSNHKTVHANDTFHLKENSLKDQLTSLE